MKINSLNLFNNFMPQVRVRGNSAQNTEYNQFDYNEKLNPSEILGRSQVNFTAQKDKKFEEYDKQFIDTTAINLRLSEKDKNCMKNFVTDFLKQNNYKSLEDIAGMEHIEEQSDFISELGADICQSDFDYNILSNAFNNRMFYDEQYVPEVDLYEKDYEVVDHILDKYGMDESQKAEIFDVIKMHADVLGGETIFDLFKPENEPTLLMSLIKDQLHLSDDLATDLLIDFGLMSEKDDEARHEGIYPWKMTTLMNEQAKDEAIACEIIGEYDLEGDEFYEDLIEEDDDDYDDDEIEETKSTMEEIAEQLNRRRDGVSVEQISYELMEKYNLPSKAFEFIANTIYEYDANELADNED